MQTRANAGRHVHLVDMFNALTIADLADGVHPNANGYNKMAAVWYSALLSEPGSCTATYRVINNWGCGFQAEVNVAKPGSSVLNGWTVRMTLAGGQSITNLWNGINTGTSGPISVKNAPYNGSIADNASTMFGFTANGNGNGNGSALPSNVGCSSP